MKSVTIKQNGKKVITVTEKEYGFDGEVLNLLSEIEIIVVTDKGEKIKAKYNK